MARLAALVPPQRMHLTRFHGVFAPHSKLREVVLRDCADDHVHMRRVLCELRAAVLEKVGKDQTDRLRRALAAALKARSA